MLKPVSFYWIPLVGLLSVAAHIIIYYARFHRWNTVSKFTDYLLFFVAGALGGWILTYVLNRQISGAQRLVVLIAFLLASPIALMVMLAGGLLGPLGVLIFPQIPWALFAWIGSSVGMLIFREG